MANWTPSSLRLVSFTHPTMTLPDAAALWNLAFGTQPQTYQTTPPQLGAPPVAGSMAQGTTPAGPAQIQVQFGRTDLVFLPAEGNPQELPKMLNFDAALAEGQKIIQRFSASPVRIALTFEAIQAESTQLAASAKLVAEVPQLMGVPADAIDLALTLNRRTKAHGLDINRLIKWSTGSAQFFQFQMAPGSNPAMPFAISEFHFVQMAGDFNTAPLPNAMPLPVSVIPELWAALAEETRKALHEGYAYAVR